MAQSISSFYGPGTSVDDTFTPVPQDASRILHELAAKTPGFTCDASLLNGVNFTGNDLPAIPGPIKSTAVTAALHAMAGIIGHQILSLRGQSTDNKTSINTDAVNLFFNTPAVASIDGIDGPAVMQNPSLQAQQTTMGFIGGSKLDLRTSAIYPTKTLNTWYQVHGSMDASSVLKALDIDPTQTVDEREAYEIIKKRTLELEAAELELLMLEHGLCGTIVYSPAGWRATRMGKDLARHPLVNGGMVPLSETIPPPKFAPLDPSDRRPLDGVKVLELARIIAAPAAGAILSSMGAEVIRIQSKELPEYVHGCLSLTAGKKMYDLDINNPSGHQQLIDLMSSADIIIQGYRIGSLARRGFGLDTAIKIAAARGKGIVYVDENCYGPDGYYAERPGWQQVADAAAGSSYVMAKSFGLPEGQGVLPSLPISDMSTGALTAVNAMLMLRNCMEKGGVWHGTSALTAYNALTLEPWVGLYAPETVQKVKERYTFPTWDGRLHVVELYWMMFKAWKEAGGLLDREDIFQTFADSAYGKNLRILAPIVRYQDEKATPRWSSPPEPYCCRTGVPQWGK
ncbi:CoA-transferase family III [Pseudovirgaria hyperparasitica]|uniref:CoA-transferase family III n=1 Tax=Pseudovirgaria hyperparasitica TaxID=470096 RepID=A0A6A6VVF5_9PEZI|nr:CoA-transferase family III [Pseudovirgaria hyperparasitica]KAF2754552.1 CoA-transferase family III [Pseudovirgaria hyperparasitica]